MRWFLRITTNIDKTFLFPYEGFKTKREAMGQLELAKSIKANKHVEVVKDKRF